MIDIVRAELLGLAYQRGLAALCLNEPNCVLFDGIDAMFGKCCFTAAVIIGANLLAAALLSRKWTPSMHIGAVG